MELATDGRVVLGERREGDPPIPVELQAALSEWGAFAITVARTGGPAERELLQRRGHQLASRVADVLGRPVVFTDPVTGRVEPVRMGAAGPVPQLAPEPPGPTPWTTGLLVSLYFAVLVAFGDIVLTRAFAEAFGLLWVPANLLVGLGLAPSLYLLRRTPFWRWPAIGAAAGLVVSWVVLVMSLLG